LICKTLGSTTTTTAARPGRRSANTASSSVADRPPVEVVSRPRRSSGSRLGLWLLALVAAALAIWFIVGLVSTVLHVIALVAVAAAAGWLGYRVGHWQGRRHPDA
jgi:uncharacterized membrane protein